MRSFYFKNFIFGSSLVMLSFIIFGAAFFGLGRNYMLSERRDSIESNVSELSRLSSAYARGGSLSDWELRIVLSTIAQSTGNHCFISDTEGTVVNCSDTDFNCEHLGKTLDSSVMGSLRSAGAYSALSKLGGFYAESHYVAALPISRYDGAVIGFVFVASDTAGLIRLWNTLMEIFLISAFSILVLSVYFSFVMAKRQGKPINEMAEAAVKFAHGDFSARVSADSRDDEIGALADSFNRMAESLQSSENRRNEFLANVAHELKTPMTTISGFADGILDGTIPYEKQGQYLETISSETKRLNRLVRKMLDLSKMQAGDPEELRQKSFDAGELLVRTLLVFESRINAKGLEVNLLVPEDSIVVCGDADAINQVIYNLLENALKFAVPGSELGVSLFKQGGKAYISVKNHGDSIPEEDLPFIFDRFHKADKSRSLNPDGVGLGLYIVKTILDSHGEDIAVTSRDGVTEFVFSLTIKGK